MKRFVLILFAVLALAGSASADTLTVPDADDSPGALDIAWVKHSHGSTHRRLVHTIQMYEPWDSTILAGRETWIGIFVQSDRDRYEHSDDRFVWVKYSEGRGLYATMHELGNHPNGPIVGRPKVSRPDDHTVRIVFQRRWLEGKPKAYRYAVESSYENDEDENCRNDSETTGLRFGACLDRVPELGDADQETFIRHRIR